MVPFQGAKKKHPLGFQDGTPAGRCWYILYMIIFHQWQICRMSTWCRPQIEGNLVVVKHLGFWKNEDCSGQNLVKLDWQFAILEEKPILQSYKPCKSDLSGNVTGHHCVLAKSCVHVCMWHTNIRMYVCMHIENTCLYIYMYIYVL